MKKNLLGIIAVVLGVSLSAFTTTTEKSQDLWYKDGSTFHQFEGEGCPTDVQVQCIKTIPGVGDRPIYTEPNDLSPLMTRQ